MPDHTTNRQQALMQLMQAISSRDRSTALRMIADSRDLVTQTIVIGASRHNATDYFLHAVGHYAYAGDTALHISAAAYETEFARELVALGANVRARNRRGAEPLHYAADGAPGSQFWNPHAQFTMVEFLIESGADPNALDKSGVAPIHRAVRTRSTSAVRALLTNGADVMQKNGSGSTPLHLAVQTTGRGGSGSEACRSEQAEIIRLLLSHGASPTDRNSAGKSVSDSVTAEWVRKLLRTLSLS